MSAKGFNDAVFQGEKLSGQSNGHNVEIEVLDRLGANLASFRVDDQELIYFRREKLLEDEDFYTGCFMMFPTPCRLTNAQYEFQGRGINQAKHGQKVDIHGLVRDETFAVSRRSDGLLCSIEIDKNHPVFEGYPFPCRFSLEFTLLERGLQIAFEFENTGSGDAPFGYGLHPFWLIPGKRKDVYIQVPCDQILDLVNLIPTGETSGVEGTDLDLRSFRCLSGLDIDNAFWHRDPTGEQAIQYRDLGKQLTLHSSDVFEHMIAYAPADEPFVCMENLTCSPDAPNVYAKGKKEVSGLKVVAPGEKISGLVRYIVTDL